MDDMLRHDSSSVTEVIALTLERVAGLLACVLFWTQRLLTNGFRT